MTQTGDDKELVLGNKQLISLFFVVVALCGVFFAMGYMIGRNSGKATLAIDVATPSSLPANSPQPAAAQRQQPEPPRETETAPPATTAPASDTSTAPLDTRPAQDTPAPTPYRPEPQPADAKGVSAPESGASYLQVTALPRADADGVVKTLRDQNFPVILAASSKDGLFRVLVGPYRQTAQLADAKSRLKTIGFGSAFVQKQ
jgi:cell division septation protein DedD